MEYRIVISTDKLDFESKVNQMVNLGWQPIGSHKVITSRTIVRGSETYNTNEYSQTMIKGDFIKDEVIHLLKGLKEDAEMAMSGEWDCTTSEGIETGFGAQIDLIDKVLDKLK